MSDSKFLCSSSRGYFTSLPSGFQFVKLCCSLFWLTAKTHATCLGSSNAFGLTLPDKSSFCFCNVAKELQNNVSNKHSSQVAPLPGVE